jgi:subtilisin family serine protease
MKINRIARWSLFLITLFWVVVIASSRSYSAREQNPAINKIAPWVLEKTANGAEAEFLVVLNDQADLSAAKTLPTKNEKGRFVRDALWQKAQSTQAPLLAWLRDRKVEHRSYYIVNMIWVKGTADLALALSARPDVARIEGNPVIHNYPDEPVVEETSAPDAPATVETGINYTKAPQVWAAGFTGQGIVIGGADTGYRWDHNSLKGKYRGWDGTTADHNYNWHDSIHTGGGSCGPNSPAPCDDFGHGTHTMGTMVGDDGGTNQVGMAPGAKWIGCRNMDGGNGTPATYMECFEFYLAPYPIGGTPAQGDPTKAPDLTSNSWGCPASEGCSALTLQSAVEAHRSAGIMTVVAAGNAGPSCSTVNDPPAIYDASYSVGALTNGTDSAASFSSRGPVTLDGSMRRKPDISAPGTNVRSCLRTSVSSYGTMSGTSMACPHIAGAVALLWSAKPWLKHNIDQTEIVLNTSAAPILANTCDGGGPLVSPNNTFGYGRIDIKAAVDQMSVVSAVSRKTHGAAGTFDIPLPQSGAPGVECRSSGGAHTIVFTFNNAVATGNATIVAGTGTVASSSISGSTMTVNLTGVTDVQQITVKLSGVTGTAAQIMPDSTITMNVLAGDVNGNKSVTATDVGAVKSQASVAVDATTFRSDVVVSGTINASDIGLVKANAGHSLP